MPELIIKIIIAMIVSTYYVQRFRKYIDNRKNNNITGDVLFRWESVSLIDKYHIRERFLGGSKLRIKRDARRHEIKYYWITYIFMVLFIVSALKAEDMYVFALTALSLIFIIKILFDRVEYKNNIVRILTGSIGLILSICGYIYFSAHIYSLGKISHIFKKFIINGKALNIQAGIYIPSAVVLAVIVYSLVKKRLLSLFICICVVIATVVSVGISGFPGTSNYLLIYYTGYMYITFLIMQSIYNIRALKKITFIK